MKRVYVNEEWCLGCHLCEYNCAYANSGLDRMEKLKNIEITPRIRVEEGGKISYAVSCRHCTDPMCVKCCITGAMHVENGVIRVDKDRCVGCQTCILACPYGCVAVSEGKSASKCELCLNNSAGAPACAAGCPNRAIVWEER